MRRIAVVVTARPSYARIKSTLEAIRDHSELDLQLVLAASASSQHDGSVSRVMQADGFEPEVRAHTLVEGDEPVSAAKSTGQGILELSSLFDHQRPDAVLTVADRYETLATAVAASYLHIPLIHVQGGELSGSIDERVRHAVTKLADIHFVAHEKAQQRVITMGERPESVFVTGCPSIDLAAAVRRAWDPTTFQPFALLDRQPTFDPQSGYLVVMQHPVTTHHDRAGQEIIELTRAIAEVGLPAFWFQPNVDPGSHRIQDALKHCLHERTITMVDNLPPEDFLSLLLGCRCLVGNSSVGVREAAFLGVPTVNVGDRQDGRDRGNNLVDVPCEQGRIVEAIHERLRARITPDSLYGDGTSGPRMAELLAGIALGVEKRWSPNIPVDAIFS